MILDDEATVPIEPVSASQRSEVHPASAPQRSEVVERGEREEARSAPDPSTESTTERSWYQAGLDLRMTHLLVLEDETASVEEVQRYPFYVSSGESALEVAAALTRSPMSRVRAAYALHLDFDAQRTSTLETGDAPMHFDVLTRGKRKAW